jgi:LysR family transcriptional regulator, glycine cleavage system transcriptional activator
MFFVSNCDINSHMKRSYVPLNALRAFEASARHGRQLAAAEELGVTHGAISRQVRQLEEHLGVLLFEGSRHQPVLTAAGASLGLALTEAFNAIDAAVRATRGTQAGILDVACLSTFAMRWLIPRLYRFQALHPGIDVRLSTNERNIDYPQMRVDMSILVLDGHTKAHAGDVVLFRERVGVVLSPALVAAKSITALADLEGVTRLMTRTRPNAWSIWQEETGMASQGGVTSAYDHYSFAIEAAARSSITRWKGTTQAPSPLAAERLVAPFGFIETGYRYIVRRRRPDNALTTPFCEWLKNEIKNA